MAGTPHTGLKRLLAAFDNSIAGFRATWQHEEAFRQEVILLVIALPLSYWVGDSLLERALLISVLLLLMIVELLNSAIETVVDRIGLERHELSGRAKDQGSTAVLLASLIAAGTWLAVLFG